MLTEKDNAWLEKRQESRLRYGWRYCRHCEFLSEDYDHWTGYCKMLDCPMIDFADYKDAAEFEARVQKHIMELYTRAIYNTYNTATKGPHLRPRADILRDARIAAEQEMEKNHD